MQSSVGIIINRIVKFGSQIFSEMRVLLLSSIVSEMYVKWEFFCYLPIVLEMCEMRVLLLSSHSIRNVCEMRVLLLSSHSIRSVCVCVRERERERDVHINVSQIEGKWEMNIWMLAKLNKKICKMTSWLSMIFVVLFWVV